MQRSSELSKISLDLFDEIMEVKCSDNNETYPSLTDSVILATQITGSITCLLSILGSSVIILTYAAFKDLRTPARQLLVSLSVADILIAASHFVGLFANYERLISVDDEGVTFVSNSSYLDAVCITQGAFSVYGTLASFLLSMLIAVYLLVLTQSKSVKPARCLIPIIYIVSWGIPLVPVAVVGGLQSYGYEPLSNPGWCYTRGKSTIHGHSLNSVLADVLSYEFWSYLCFFLLTALYISLFFSMYLRCQCCKKVSDTIGYSRARGDLKLLFVPMIFFVLRIWTAIIDAGLHYTTKDQQKDFKCSQASAVLSVLAGIGLNAQGFANALLFCAFTKQVREQLVNSSSLTWIRLKLCCRRRVIGDKHRFITSYSVRDEAIQVLIKNGRTNYGSSVDNDQLTLTLTE